MEGVLNGRVTIYTTQDIFITDDILYADDPRINPDSDDMLGLVTMQKVEVKDTPENNIKCEINGSIMAIDESFQAENIFFTPVGKLVVYGGIIQSTRGPVGTSIPTGYSKYYRYDKRLEFSYPPFYPVAAGAFDDPYSSLSDISIISWYE